MNKTFLDALGRKQKVTYNDRYWKDHNQKHRCRFWFNGARCHLPVHDDGVHMRNVTTKQSVYAEQKTNGG